MRAIALWRWCGIFLLGGCVAAAPGSRQDDDEERPTAQPIKGGSEASMYPEAVLINMLAPQQSYCSGSLIAPRVVITAGHCVVSFSSFEVIAPYANNQSSYSSQGATFDYADTGQNVNPNQHDVGVIILDTPIDIPEYLIVPAQPVAFGTNALNIGRIDNGQLSMSSLFVSQPLPMNDATSIGYPFDYVSNEIIEPGDSGGPVVLEGPAPRTVIAVNSGGGQGEEILARTDLVYAWLQDQIANAGGPGNPGNPGGGGGPPGGPPDPGQPPPGGGSCNPCQPGPPLDPQCDPCIDALCYYDPYCCMVEVDYQCMMEVEMICGPVCGP
jgi:hypothetical protein